MTTFTSLRGAADFPTFRSTGSGLVCAAYGHYDVAIEPVPADIYVMCKVPAGAVVLGGWLRYEDIDTNASETMDLDVGWAANGNEVADPDGFGNFGIQDGDAVTAYLPEGGVLLPLHGVLKDGFKTFVNETNIIITCVDDPATFTAGTISLVVLYVVP
jgi:hypothetical protein